MESYWSQWSPHECPDTQRFVVLWPEHLLPGWHSSCVHFLNKLNKDSLWKNMYILIQTIYEWVNDWGRNMNSLDLVVFEIAELAHHLIYLFTYKKVLRCFHAFFFWHLSYKLKCKTQYKYMTAHIYVNIYPTPSTFISPLPQNSRGRGKWALKFHF